MKKYCVVRHDGSIHSKHKNIDLATKEKIWIESKVKNTRYDRGEYTIEVIDDNK